MELSGSEPRFAAGLGDPPEPVDNQKRHEERSREQKREKKDKKAKKQKLRDTQDERIAGARSPSGSVGSKSRTPVRVPSETEADGAVRDVAQDGQTVVGGGTAQALAPPHPGPLE